MRFVNSLSSSGVISETVLPKRVKIGESVNEFFEGGDSFGGVMVDSAFAECGSDAVDGVGDDECDDSMFGVDRADEVFVFFRDVCLNSDAQVVVNLRVRVAGKV